MSNKVNRRDFLKIMGWGGVGATLAGCDMPSYVTLEQGKEKVMSYVVPEEYVIPGVGVYYASTCQQCPAGCGLHGRVREGRVLKLEGNPASAINSGKLCQMGQSGVQAHYNPDRITQPMMRKGGRLSPVSWDDALKMLDSKMGAASDLQGDRVAWFTDTISGHQRVLLEAHLKSVGSDKHFVHEVINNQISQAVNRASLGEAQPHLRLDKAQMIFSIGDDFLGAGISPVHNTRMYTEFRNAPRGVLVQAEPKMTLTGMNADLWVPVRPGTEGVLALGIANVLVVKHRKSMAGLPASVQKLIRSYNVNSVARETGAPGNHIIKIASWLNERSPSLVISGAAAEGHEHGFDSAAAAMVLNIILGNVGKTIESSGSFPFPQLRPKAGSSKALLDFAKALEAQQLDVVFFKGANPVYHAPQALNLEAKLSKVGFKVALSQFQDETTMMADLVLPLYSAMEDWGTHVADYQPHQHVIGIQQPLMQPLYPETRGFGDVLLSLLKQRKAKGYDAYKDYYGYLRAAFSALPENLKNGLDNNSFWAAALQAGVLKIETQRTALTPKAVDFKLRTVTDDHEYPLSLVPSARLGMWDGRHANIPWLQEAPDQISKVVWNSWAEIHPRTAQKLGVKTGDAIKISSKQGSIVTRVYVYKGVHQDVVAVPLGQGHDEYGRYAKGRGVNPLKILGVTVDQQTGELAHHGTRVKASRADAEGMMVKIGGSDVQAGRKIVATVTADVFERTEGEV